jgi:hypothetical protein
MAPVFELPPPLGGGTGGVEDALEDALEEDVEVTDADTDTDKLEALIIDPGPNSGESMKNAE